MFGGHGGFGEELGTRMLPSFGFLFAEWNAILSFTSFTFGLSYVGISILGRRVRYVQGEERRSHRQTLMGLGPRHHDSGLDGNCTVLSIRSLRPSTHPLPLQLSLTVTFRHGPYGTTLSSKYGRYQYRGNVEPGSSSRARGDCRWFMSALVLWPPSYVHLIWQTP